MSKFDEVVSQQFRAWEIRGRGGRLFDRPVCLEPPFLPFTGYDLAQHPVDEGRRSTYLSRFWSNMTGPKPPAPVEKPVIEEEGPFYREPDDCQELQLTLPDVKPFPRDAFVPFFHQVFRIGEPLVFELVGTPREIVPQFVAPAGTLNRVERALPQFFTGITTIGAEETLMRAWSESAPYFAAIELCLGREFMLPLGETKTPILTGVVNALDGLRERELALLQILIEPAQNPWEDHIAPAILTTEGKPIFVNRPELVNGAERKLSSAFVAVVVRLAASAENVGRCWDILQEMSAPFGALAQRGANFLMPLSNDGYEPLDHEEDILLRASRRTGMLLNAAELTSLLAFPTTAVSRRLRRDTARSHPVPEELRRRGSLLLGANLHAGHMEPVWLSTDHRVRHVHLIGASGTGKSTLLFNLLRQDIEQGQGVALLDPHGDLVDRVLGIIPPERRDDVVLVDPSDEEHVVGFNILAAHSDFERNLLASDLVSVFRRLSTSWGEQMNSVLRNAILAFLESSRGGTLADLRRFLLDQSYRREFLQTVADSEVVFYWERAFPQLTGNKSVGPVLTRLDEFLSRKPIRYMVSQKENRLDFAEILDRGKILLVKLAQGQLGRENANLLGSVIVSKIQQMAMSRQRMHESERRDFWVYLDEFHSFITPSMAEILTGARKYRVGLVLAHQELHQLDADRDVASAVLANCGTRVVFRVSDRDARELESGFAHFKASDLQNLNTGEAICRVGRSEADFNLLIPEPEAVDERATIETRESVIAASHARYARLRTEVEAELMQQRQAEARPKPEPRPRTAPTPLPEAPPIVSEAPAVSESQTVSEKKAESAAAAKSQAQKISEEPITITTVPTTFVLKPAPDLGRGGMIHKDAQNRIRAVAHELGFNAKLEAQVGSGGADLVLDRDGLSIGVEISVTTGVTHEVENVLKCLNGEFGHVAFVTSDTRKQEQVRERVLARVSEADARRMGFYQVETFLDFLQTLPKAVREISSASAPPKSATRKVGNWTVKTKFAAQTSEEARVREEESLIAIAEMMRTPPSKS